MGISELARDPRVGTGITSFGTGLTKSHEDLQLGTLRPVHQDLALLAQLTSLQTAERGSRSVRLQRIASGQTSEDPVWSE